MRGVLFVGALVLLAAPTARSAEFRAGAAEVDINPPSLPVRVNGGFLEATADKVVDPLFARALVLDDGATRLALVVVDSCMMTRELLDDAKRRASERSGIPVDRMMISATHTHSAPAAMGALGCRPDPNYPAFLPGKIAEAIDRAAKALEPARAGAAAVDDPAHTHCRRWIRRPDRIGIDPFGRATIRANMHPGYQSPDAIGPSGPVDPGLTVLSVQAADGRPIALLANYSMHYVGSPALSSDYFGKFASTMRSKLGRDGAPFVAMMSQGTSGDQMWMDYGSPTSPIPYDRYAEEVAGVALKAHAAIEHRADVTLGMAEATLRLRRRIPDAERVAWAAPILEKMGDRPPRDLPEVYAREVEFLRREPERELKLQAIRIGDLAITAIPNEVYAITGLKLKAMSPLPLTMNVELANGSEGYIPPPEQHDLGGYTTWPARTAGLEVGAEPRIVETLLGLLETAVGQPRRAKVDEPGAYRRAVLASKPIALWGLGEIQGTLAADATGGGQPATYESGVALYLDGPDAPGLSTPGRINRAPHLAGGRIRAALEGVGTESTVELWFWNGLPASARPVAGYLFGRGVEGADGAVGDHLGLGGSESSTGRLFFAGSKDGARLDGTTPIEPKTWHHLALVRSGDGVAVYLDGRPEPEIRGTAGKLGVTPCPEFFFGGRPDGAASWEGKLDEIAVFDRALTAEEIAAHVRAAGP